jgi:hypothetical protein
MDVSSRFKPNRIWIFVIFDMKIVLIHLYPLLTELETTEMHKQTPISPWKYSHNGPLAKRNQIEFHVHRYPPPSAKFQCSKPDSRLCILANSLLESTSNPPHRARPTLHLWPLTLPTMSTAAGSSLSAHSLILSLQLTVLL